MSNDSNNEFETRYKNWHQKISFVKSGVRIVACLGCAFTFLTLGHIVGGVPSVLILTLGLTAAEILGIVEEWL